MLSQYPFGLKVSVNAKIYTVNQTEYISEYTAKATQTNEYEPKQKFLNFFILPRKFPYVSRFSLPFPPPPARPTRSVVATLYPLLLFVPCRSNKPQNRFSALQIYRYLTGSALVGLGKESIDTSNEKGSNVYACSFIILYTLRLVRFDCAMLVKLDLSAVLVPYKTKKTKPKMVWLFVWCGITDSNR